MEQFIASIVVITIIFSLCFFAMNIGMVIRGKKMRGGCGSTERHNLSDGENKNIASCGFCSEKKRLNICSSENKDELKDISKLGTLSRYEK